MDNFDNYWHVLKDRQAELAYELQKEVMLRDPNQAPGTRRTVRTVLLSLAVAAVLLVVIVASGAHLFV